MDQKHRIMIVEDSVESRQHLVKILENNYEIVTAVSGPDALELLKEIKEPDLILLDVMMPEMDGYELCSRIKEDPATGSLPVIFISARGDIDDEMKGFEIGAVDYITKPFSPPVVRARIATQIELRSSIRELEKLNKLALDANPKTGLPGNNSIADAIRESIACVKANCVLYLDLDNFKAYNDHYGFARGDEVIQFSADIMAETGKQFEDNYFLGHVGGDDFVMIVSVDNSRLIAEEIMRKFRTGIRNFYDKKSAAQGHIESTDRLGKKRSFPLMTISIGGVRLCDKRFTSYLEVNDACAEVKKQAKELPGSSFFIDRRS